MNQVHIASIARHLQTWLRSFPTRFHSSLTTLFGTFDFNFQQGRCFGIAWSAEWRRLLLVDGMVVMAEWIARTCFPFHYRTFNLPSKNFVRTNLLVNLLGQVRCTCHFCGTGSSRSCPGSGLAAEPDLKPTPPIAWYIVRGWPTRESVRSCSVGIKIATNRVEFKSH